MNKKISNFYTILVIIYPIIYTYLSSINSITIADFLLAIILIVGICDIIAKKEKLYILVFLLLIIIYLCFHQCLSFLIYGYNSENFYMFLRVLFYFVSCLILSRRYFNYDFGFSVYKIMSLFSSIYLIIQYVLMKTIHYYLPGTIPFLKTSNDILEYNIKMMTTSFDRPRSIFIEPAHFAIYVSVFLAIYLFSNKKINYKLILILTLAILLSGSSTGIGSIAIIYLIYFYKNLYHKKIGTKNLILFFLFFVVIVIFTQTQIFDIFVKRTFYTSDAVSGRFSTYSILSNNSFSNLQKLFGMGFYKTENFNPSFIRIFLFNGLFGLVLYHIIIIKVFKDCNDVGNIVILLFYIFSLSSSIVYSRWIILIIPILISNIKISKQLVIKI